MNGLSLQNSSPNKMEPFWYRKGRDSTTHFRLEGAVSGRVAGDQEKVAIAGGRGEGRETTDGKEMLIMIEIL